MSLASAEQQTTSPSKVKEQQTQQPDNTGEKVEDQEEEEEFMLSSDPSKYVTLPVQYEKIWRKYQTTLDWFWTIHDVYLTDDKKNMKLAFDEQQRKCILDIITFMFIAHNTTITKELFMQLINQVDIKEASYYFGSQADAKKTHALMYSKLLDELCENIEHKNKLISDVVKMSPVRDALKWCMSNVSSNNDSFARRLLAFASLQGIIFVVPFVLFSWIQKTHGSDMPGLTTSNKYIWRDEKLNLSLSCMLFEYIEDELDKKEAISLVETAVAHAKNLFTKVFPVSTLGMDYELVSQFIEHSADKILSDIRVGKIYNKESPFDWVVEPEIESDQAKNFTVGSTTNNNFDTNFTTDVEF